MSAERWECGVADRYYRQVIGYTADQIRAGRQLRFGRVAAATTYVALGGFFLLALAPVPVAGEAPGIAQAGAMAITAAVFAMAATAALAIGFSRWFLAPAHPFHAGCARRAWALLPLGALFGWLGWSAGSSAVLLSAAALITILVAVADGSLRRVERVGHHTSRRVCVINLDSRVRTWHTEDELRALDEASRAMRAGFSVTPDEAEPA